MTLNQLTDTYTRRIAAVLAVSSLALGLAACNKPAEPTVGQRLDSAVEKTEAAAADAKARADAALKTAEVKVQEGAASVQAGAKEMGEAAKEGMNQAADKASGNLADASLTAQISSGLAKDPSLSALRINVDTVNGAVTLNGPAKSAADRERAEAIAKAVPGVKSVTNLLTVTPG